MWGLKTFGRGLITILISPLILAAVLIMAVYGFVVYLIYEVSSIYLFFLGKNFSSDDEETIKLKEAMALVEPGYYKVDQPITRPIESAPQEVENKVDGGNNNV
jgi:hypothetical protein